MSNLTLKAVAIFLLSSYVSLRFLVPLVGQEILSRCLGSVFFVVASYLIATRATSGGKIASTQGKAVLITGCDTGMGNALARRLDGLGFRVFAGCLSAERGEGAAGLRQDCSERLRVMQLNVTSDKEVKKAVVMVEAALAKTGDVLWGVVNNAGVAEFGVVEWISMDTYQKVMDVNVWGMVRITQAFLPLIRKSKGRIVNMSSVLGRFSSPYCTAYCMTKYAVQALTDALRIEMFPWGVKAIIVEPGTFSAGDSAMLKENTLNSGMDNIWNSAPQDIRQAYGDDYFKTVKTALILPILKTTHGSIAPVIEAYTSALTDVNPEDRYFPSNALCKFIAWANYYMPVSIMDWGFNLYLYFMLAKPQGLKAP